MPDVAEKSVAVWIVEDDPKYRETIQTIINSAPTLRCTSVFDRMEAVHDALSQQNGWDCPDVILLDFKLPGLTGIEGIAGIKAVLPDVSIVMLTNWDTDTIIMRAFKTGANGYLLKSSPIDQIIGAVEQAALGGTLMPPSVARKVFGMLREEQDTGDPLTTREREILICMGEGLNRDQIAEKLFISAHTVNSHLRKIYPKLHVKSGLEAVATAIRKGIIA